MKLFEPHRRTPTPIRTQGGWGAVVGIMVVLVVAAVGGVNRSRPPIVDAMPVLQGTDAVRDPVQPADTPTSTATPIPLDLAAALQRAHVPALTNDSWQPFTTAFADGVPMMLVPMGCFTMGSEAGFIDEIPVAKQCFTAPFWIDQTEVTQADFARLGGRKVRENGFSGYARPMERITWFEALAFCRARDARLPTEAEWEYAARGPDGLIYPWGDDFVADNGVYQSNADRQTATVGEAVRTAGTSWVGALDMSGNVWEWTSTIYGYDAYPYDAADGREDVNRTDGFRTFRGGSFLNVADDLRAANRDFTAPEFEGFGIGFRCAR